MVQKKIHPFIKLIFNNWDNTDAWPEIIEAMRLVLPLWIEESESSNDPHRWVLLPGLCCQAAGGDPSATNELSSAWLLLYIAAHIVDDVEDGDLEGDISTLGGPGSAVNVANALFLSASLILNRLHEKKELRNLATKINSDFFNTILVMTSGQHYELLNQQLTLKQWWQVAEAKSGSFFSLACRCGAQLGDDNPEKVHRYSDYGFHLGVMLQIMDDIKDLQPLFSSEVSILPESLKKSLAMTYAFDVLPDADKVKLNEWIKTPSQKSDFDESILEMLNESGAGLYMLAEAEKHYQHGLTSLEAAAPHSPAGEKLGLMLRQLKLD